MLMKLVGVIVAAGAFTCDAAGAVNVFELNSSPHVQISTGVHPSGATSVFITQLPTATAKGSVFIETTANDPLGTIEIKNQSGTHPIEVSIRGAGGDFSKRPASLIEIIGGDGSDNANEIEVRECHIVGPVDAIGGMNSVSGLIVGGGRVLYIELDHASYPGYAPPALLNSRIGGAVGAIFMPFADSRIDGVELEESLGDGGLTSFIYTDHIGTLHLGGLASGSWIQGGTSLFVTSVQQIIFDDALSGDGVFAGELWINKLEPAGGAPGALTFSQGIAATGVVGIKKQLLLDDSEIHLPENGLAGRIIIGADGQPGDWTGAVNIGALTLTGAYDEASADLGGGVVGAVPFKTHGADSVPAFGAAFDFGENPVSPGYAIRHYGWVWSDPQATDPEPIRLERRARCIGSVWLDVTEEWGFEYDIPSVAQPGTIVALQASQPAHYRNGFEYRFVREATGTDTLYCFLETPDPPLLVPVAPYPDDAWFTVGSQCPWDTNGDSFVGVDDLNAVLGDWEETGPNLYGDIDGDGVVGVDDLNFVLSHWEESGCAGCSESLMMMGGASFSVASFGGAGALMETLGYGSVESFCEDLNGMDSAEQAAMLAALSAAAASE